MRNLFFATLSALVSGAALLNAHVSNETYPVLLREDGGAVVVERTPAVAPDGEESWRTELDEAAGALVAGPFPSERESGATSFFPEGSRFDGVDFGPALTSLRLTLSERFPAGVDEEHLLEDLWHLAADWAEKWPEAGDIVFRTRLEGEEEYAPIGSEGDLAAVPAKPEPDGVKDAAMADADGEDRLTAASQPHFPAQGTAQPQGALSGASVFLSPGHGWFYSSNLNRWATQRGNNYQYIEDHGTAEAALQYLHQYLWNAGASVYTLRERCLNTNMVIVEQGGDGYGQTGSWTTETISGAYNGAQRRATTVTGEPTATATYTPNIPEAGHYGVYVWYRRAGSGTTTADARIAINHTGDSTTWVQNQNHDGFTWKYIGTYHFDEGVNPDTGSVTITNESSVAGREVIAGAVRFGGGMGDVPDPGSGTISGKPRWEESGRYYAGFMGVPNWENNGTVSAMPRMAAWEHESYQSGRSVYVSWHTNAGGGTGTETFAYSSSGWNGPFDGVAGGDKLRDYLQQTTVRDIRAEWDPGWVERHNNTANFGELNPNNNPHMPAALIEVGFHDHAGDTKHLLDPEFRRTAARAVYKGILQYFYHEVSQFDTPTYLPEPPRAFRVANQEDGSVKLEWIPPVYSTGLNGLHGHQATGYRVYRSSNGKGFDNGREADGTSHTFDDVEPGETVYFRVTATNAGGESFPTSVLAARRPSDPDADGVVLVQGFNRLDRFLNIVENDPHSSNPLQRGYIRQMNTFDYAIQHAEAVEASGEDVAVDSAEALAVDAGYVGLDPYRAAIWMAGQQAHVNDIGDREFRAFSAGGRHRIASYLSGGGRIFVSGSEIAYDQDQAGQAGFLRQVLKVEFDGRSASSNTFRGASASIMAEVGSTGFGSSDPRRSVYHVEHPDAVSPFDDAVPMLRYMTDPPEPQVVDGFESLGGWRHPGWSGSTNADPAGTFEIVSSPVYDGGGAAHFGYIFGGGGDFIRVYNAAEPEFPADSDFSIWVFGDNSGHRVRFAVRDSDGELYVNEYTTIDFEGWREIVWEDVRNNSIFWAVSGDGVVTGPNVRFDSIQLSKTSGGPVEGDLYFDLAVSSPIDTGQDDLSDLAGIQYDGDYQVVYLATPFESIEGEATRTAMMSRALEFFGIGRPAFVGWQERYFTSDELDDEDIAGPYADPSSNGLPNILHFAFGLSPWQTGRGGGFPEVWREDGSLRFGFWQSLEALDDLDFVIEVSDDLGEGWRDAGDEVEWVVSPEENGVRWVEVRDDSPSEEGRRFMRLRVDGN